VQRRFFHTLLNNHLYRRAVDRPALVPWVLSEYRVASLTLLLDNGLSVNQKLGSGNLLRWICDIGDEKRSVQLVRLLIERGADTKAKLDGSRTVLHEAVITDNLPITHLLLAHGADANATDEQGMTPLHWACLSSRRDNQVPPVKVLLDHGANINININAGTNHRCSPLWHAWKSHMWEMCALLLEHGANTSGWPSYTRKYLLCRVEQWQKKGV
jgi:ankyrin repeat protein